MAVLSAAERLALRGRLSQRLSADREAIALTKPQMDAAIAAADDWCDANAASFNSALPVAARNNLTARQKAMLLVYVAVKRFGD